MTINLLDQFISESRDLLQSASDMLLQLERSPKDATLINEVFRSVHTMKGNSGLFEFPEMTRVLHSGEDLLGTVREGKLAYSHEIADKLLEAIDFVVLLTDEIESTQQISPHHQAIAQKLAAELNALNITNEKAKDEYDGANSEEKFEAIDDFITQLPDALRKTLSQKLKETDAVFIRYQPEPECFFKGEDPFYMARQTPDVVWSNVEQIVEEKVVDDETLFDPYRCQLVFNLVSTADLDTIREHFKYVPEQVTLNALSEESWVNLFAASDNRLADENHSLVWSGVSEGKRFFAEDVINRQREILTTNLDPSILNGVIRAVSTTLLGVLNYAQQTQLNESLLLASEQAEIDNNVEPILDWITQLSSNADTKTKVDESTSTVVMDAATEAKATSQESEPETKFGRRAEDGLIAKTIKVDQEKIDQLMNLIGEMVVAKNSLPYLASRAENQYGVRELSREIKNQYIIINRIADEMQQSIMQIRMMPVSFIFQRFPRLVRDISRKLGKEVDLVLAGESTEADKLIVEALAEPLIHIVRNSLDHGIEMPDKRRESGKPSAGKLSIKASQLSDSVLIEIVDDGKGIEPSAIKKKALEKGLITESVAETMSDHDAVNLVFAPGFSTADVVSDLSGRGVGMDAVRSAIERVNGTVSLESETGKGTSIRLSLPLSMAVSNVMVIESDNQLFGVPMDAVLETVRIPNASIRSIKQSKTTLLRGRLVPIVSLNELLGSNQPQLRNEEDEVAVLIVRVNGEEVGMLVDDFKSTVDIILKPLPGLLFDMKWYSGSALMGDGSVLMVLNPKELI